MITIINGLNNILCVVQLQILQREKKLEIF